MALEGNAGLKSLSCSQDANNRNAQINDSMQRAVLFILELYPVCDKGYQGILILNLDRLA